MQIYVYIVNVQVCLKKSRGSRLPGSIEYTYSIQYRLGWPPQQKTKRGSMGEQLCVPQSYRAEGAKHSSERKTPRRSSVVRETRQTSDLTGVIPRAICHYSAGRERLWEAGDALRDMYP